MEKSKHAKAIELRMADKKLNLKFNKLKDELKWKWLSYACENDPVDSIKYCKYLVRYNT